MIRIFKHYLSVRLLALRLLEAAVLFGALWAGYHLRLDFASELPLLDATVFVTTTMGTMSALGLYDHNLEGLRPTLQKLVVACGLALVMMTVIFYLAQEIYVGRGVLLYATVFGITGILAVRAGFFRLTDVSALKRRLLVVGNNGQVDKLLHLISSDHRYRNIHVCGVYPLCSDSDAQAQNRPREHDNLLREVTQQRVDEIVMAVRERRGGVLPLRQLLECKLRGVNVMDLVSFYGRETGYLPLDELRASWLITGPGFGVGRWRDTVKRTLDIVASLVMLVFALPLVALASIAIVLETGRPILYRQSRVGQGGNPFTIMKLRSMRQDAEADGKARWAAEGDDRITRVGHFIRKTRIDELPQLVNVLRGDMSFVGPRPERPEFVAELSRGIPFYAVRHSVKPGVTGWSQVPYPYAASLEDSVRKLEYDLYYVKNHSVFLDLVIMVETMQVIALGKGAR